MPRRWTDEQKQHQREVILRNQPWLKSTGPTTKQGKAVSCQNALVHGFASANMRGRIRTVMRDMKAIRRSIRRIALGKPV